MCTVCRKINSKQQDLRDNALRIVKADGDVLLTRGRVRDLKAGLGVLYIVTGDRLRVFTNVVRVFQGRGEL